MLWGLHIERDFDQQFAINFLPNELVLLHC
ncbi:MAG: hypothetical protein IT222_04995 [Crocinitomix sp.]|nr:hypothetical protein [Crocinitomix sp.]